MFRWLVVAVGLATSSITWASVGGEAPPALPHAPLTTAAAPGDVLDEKLEEKSEAEKAAEERLQAIEAAEARKIARVVVLEYPETDVDFSNETLVRNIKARIMRPDAKFYPELDLYQAGRREPNREVRPVDQRAKVPPGAVERVLQAAEETSTIPWNALDDETWGLKADELLELSRELWFVDRPELREPLFLLYTMIGYAAENSNNPSPPFYEAIGGRPVNYYYFLAGALANEDPSLMSKLTNQDLYGSINNYKEQLDRGEFPKMTLSFELEGRFDPKAFASEYQVYINGLERTITSRDATWDVNPGRVDVYLSRADGHSLSDTIQLDKLDDKVYFVRETARTRMGKDFINLLLEHPNECNPQLDGEILDYLSIYGKLHPEAEIYVGLAKGGSVASRNIFLWRWDRPTANLVRVFGDDGGFPIRFVGLVGTGAIINGANVDSPSADEIEQQALGVEPGADPSAVAANAQSALAPTLTPEIAGIPMSYQLRGHYGRLMVTTGVDFAARLDGEWQDVYQTDSKLHGPEKDHRLTTTESIEVPVECPSGSADGEVCTETTTVEVDVMRSRKWQRLVFLGVGAVLGRNAAMGFGPRGFIRTGWYNAPHAIDLTAHVGHAAMLPNKKNPTGRVRPMLDADFYGGVMIPFRDSYHIKPGKKIGAPLPTFGTTISAGLTF